MRIRLGIVSVVVGAAAAAVLVFGVGLAAAATVTVNCPGGDLQGAIDSASPGTTIVVNGTCYGNFVVSFKVLTLQGGSSGATLNGRGGGSTLEIDSLSDVTIRNLAITNGNAGTGGGIKVGSSALAMVNATVKGNRADYGGGIYAVESNVDLTGVTVTRNTARYTGGGIDVVDNTVLSMTASTVSRNTTTQPPPTMCDGGGGIRIEFSDALLTSTRVTANQSAGQGGGIAVYGAGNTLPPAPVRGAPPVALGSGLMLVNSSVDHNTSADDGGGIYNAPNEVLRMAPVRERVPVLLCDERRRRSATRRWFCRRRRCRSTSPRRADTVTVAGSRTTASAATRRACWRPGRRSRVTRPGTATAAPIYNAAGVICGEAGTPRW